ncbi:class I SAM-dependent methyltransferase [Ghiorsea bivora]|uniref:class I SAM-dependent methyltransferase n=1 Tax=Ghiorsea bivora TaxID=1485545 RepID=UPI00056EE1CD|nr:class I SAM-dependent methyltransferase [Ghiorsea bivora]
MDNKHTQNPKDIKYHVTKYLHRIQDQLQGKTVIDLPAGSGFTSQLLLNMGAKVRAFDLFPEYFKLKGVSCERADVTQGIPVKNNIADMLICQEGIEHFSDQLQVFKEFNRVLKQNGTLIITTPSYSNLAAKFSYIMFESETSSQMPPNEINDIWMDDQSVSTEIYHGHIFLIGLQKLRILARLAGFNIKEIRYVRLSRGSLVLFPFLYPLILIRSLLTYQKHMRKLPKISESKKKEVYQEQLRININPKHLLNKHTFIVFEKEKDSKDVSFKYDEVLKSFDQET